MVIDILSQTDGNHSRAANIPGITGQGWLSKIARYGINCNKGNEL